MGCQNPVMAVFFPASVFWQPILRLMQWIQRQRPRQVPERMVKSESHQQESTFVLPPTRGSSVLGQPGNFIFFELIFLLALKT